MKLSPAFLKVCHQIKAKKTIVLGRKLAESTLKNRYLEISSLNFSELPISEFLVSNLFLGSGELLKSTGATSQHEPGTEDLM